MDVPPPTARTSKTCWTCRLRRKRCDQQHPVCETCAALRITCHNDATKPSWMDGGAGQEDMARQLKREVKENAPFRRVHNTDEIALPAKTTITGASSDEWVMLSSTSLHSNNKTAETTEEAPSSASPPEDTSASSECPHLDPKTTTMTPADTILATFHLTHVLPFLYPHYRPLPITQGGTSWLLDMMARRPVVRKALLCQAGVVFSLLAAARKRGAEKDSKNRGGKQAVVCETVFAQVRDALETLGWALDVLQRGSSISADPGGAVRVLCGVVQMVRFEVAVVTFENCHVHLNAALALFGQILPGREAEDFASVMGRLGPPTFVPPANNENVPIPSPEQAAFGFSTALLLFDDVIASTMLRRRPRLQDYHRGLLESVDGEEKPVLDLEGVIGCQNWVVVRIGEIAALEEWKQERRRAGDLELTGLVERAAPIRHQLEAEIQRLQCDEPAAAVAAIGRDSLLDLLNSKSRGSSDPSSSSVTLIWAHAALLYLITVAHGWHPPNTEVQHHVSRLLDLLAAKQASAPAHFKSMAWPFCIAGCLAQPQDEERISGMVEALQPAMIFGTIRKALGIMEDAWRHRDACEGWDPMACFRTRGELVLLV